ACRGNAGCSPPRGRPCRGSGSRRDASSAGSRAACAGRLWLAWPCSTLTRVRAEAARGRELAQLVAHHRLDDEDGHVLTAVVDADGVAHHLGDDGAATAPGLDDAPVAGGVGGVDLGEEVAVHERPLLQASRHAYFSFRRRTMKRLETLRLLRVLRPL